MMKWEKKESLECELADGRKVTCPEVCIGPSELREDDELWRTKGFSSLTVLREGQAIGWVPTWNRRVPKAQVRP